MEHSVEDARACPRRHELHDDAGLYDAACPAAQARARAGRVEAVDGAEAQVRGRGGPQREEVELPRGHAPEGVRRAVREPPPHDDVGVLGDREAIAPHRRLHDDARHARIGRKERVGQCRERRRLPHYATGAPRSATTSA